MKIKFVILFLLILVLLSCQQKTQVMSEIAVIPQPLSMEKGAGSFRLNTKTLVGYLADQPESGTMAATFAQMVFPATGFELKTKAVTDPGMEKNLVLFRLLNPDDTLSTEGYHLEVSEQQILVSAKTAQGLYYGLQSLMQLLPPEIYSTVKQDVEWMVPAVKILDEPRFPYRGMHLDVSRHFFPKEFVKKYIDLIAHYKMNIFHWHLTDDNGWRIEIKKYPELTTVGAWRVDRENEKWNNRTPPKPGEKATYGGFYTQEDIREIVQYAASKYVEIIPEIEMPGHTSAVMAAYPELACFKKDFYVQPGGYWPITDIFCAGKEETFQFLENVLSEVIELFPSQYVHVGGDEADRTNWKTCRLCQQRMRAEKLKDDAELQSYFIKRIEKFLTAHNKKLIGWDEILDGGLAPSATVMSWRGVEGGIASARMGHQVIMCPVSHCYFDYYQANPEFEPEAIGGFTTLKKVYHYEPVPEELNAEEAKYISGAQGNLWTEYIATPDHAEYMALPRMTALAEVVWSKKEARNWDDFRQRFETEKKRLKLMDVNYSEGSWQVDFTTTYDSVTRSFTVTPESEILNAAIRYTLDGSEPTSKSELYTKPILIQKTSTLKAAVFEKGKLKEKVSEKTIISHSGIGPSVKYLSLPSERYFSSGAPALVDGLTGSLSHGDGFWQGFNGKDAEVVIDLHSIQTVNKVSASFLHNQRSWILLPVTLEVQFSDDGISFSGGKTLFPDFDQKADTIAIHKFLLDNLTAKTRYIRFFARNATPLPAWHPGKGEPAWLFIDEIMIE